MIKKVSMNDKKHTAIIEFLAQKWWFYLIILICFFIPSFSTRPITDPGEISILIMEVLQKPITMNFHMVFPAVKILTLLLIAGLFVFKNKIARFVLGFFTLLSLFVAVFQNMGFTNTYGFSVLIGNVMLQIVAAAFLFYETITAKSDFSHPGRPWWKYMVIPFALFAFWMPMNQQGGPDFNPLLIITNESMVTYCMLTPVMISILTLYHPSVNRPVLRVISFIAMLYGIMNFITWFFINPEFWWIGVLHIPLYCVSIYGFVLSFIPGKA